MPASYPSSLFAFTPINNGDTSDASQIDNPVAEIIAIETGLLSGFQHVVKPLTDNTYDLGTSSLAWRDLFVKRNLTHLGYAGVGAPLVSNASKQLVEQALTNGQLLIGSTGAAPVAAGLTAGAGITITPAAGAITIAQSSTVGVLDRVVTLVSFSNTAAEQTLYSFAVPGGTLGTNKIIKLSVIGDHLINNGAPDSLRIKAKYGATTIFDGTIASINNGANRGAFTFDLELVAANATNAQRSKGFLQVGDSTQNNAAGTAGSILSTNTYTMYGVHNAIAEDSTASKNLVVTATMGTANAAIDVRVHTVYTELHN